jgi:ABC-type Fe3+ transport system permease subunit
MSGTSVRGMARSPFVLVVAALLTWFIAAFLVWPNVNILVATFFPDGSFSGRAAEKLFSSQRAMKALGNSFLLAVALSITVNLVGLFIVLVTHYFRIRGSRILFLGYASTFIYGGIVLAAGYKFIYGDKGIVTSLLVKVFPGLDPGWFSGFFAVLVVMTFATTTNHMLFVANALKGIDYQTVEAARNLGASTWTILRRIVLPMLKPTLFAVTILSFLTGLGALSAPQVLGGRDFQTITPMILTFTNSPTSRDLAALLAVILGVATILMLAVMSRLEKGGTYFSVSKVSSALEKQDITNSVANVVVHALAYLLFAVYTLPVVLIVLYSFADGAAIQTGQLALGNLTLDNYVRVLTQPSGLRPFIVSVVYSALAAVIAVGGLLFVARLLQKYKNWVIRGLRIPAAYSLDPALGTARAGPDHQLRPPQSAGGRCCPHGNHRDPADRLRDSEDPVHAPHAQGLLRLDQFIARGGGGHHGGQNPLRVPADPPAPGPAGSSRHRGPELQQPAGRLRHRHLPRPPAGPAPGPGDQGQHGRSRRRGRRGQYIRLHRAPDDHHGGHHVLGLRAGQAERARQEAPSGRAVHCCASARRHFRFR